MHEPPDIMRAFNDRIRRHVKDALAEYDRGIGTISAEMAARGRFNSGANLKRRVELLRSSMQALTDRCFEDVTRLPGNQLMHRAVHEQFLIEQLGEFFKAASAKVLFPQAPDAAAREIRSRQTDIWAGVHHDMQDFKANLWQPRSGTQGRASSVTNNTVNIHGSTVGTVQQAGEGATQSATVTFNAAAVSNELEDFAKLLQASDVSDDIKSAAMIEIETIRPQLKKPAPNTSIIQEGLHSLRNILEGVAAGVLATKLVALLAAAGIILS
jgi:hypothetical protein